MNYTRVDTFGDMTGAELQQARLVLGLTQEDLARMLGIQRNTIARYESGLLKITKLLEWAMAGLTYSSSLDDKEPNEIGVEEAATKLGISDSRVRQLIGSGRLPAKRSKVGVGWLILEEDLTLVEERKVGRPRGSYGDSTKVASIKDRLRAGYYPGCQADLAREYSCTRQYVSLIKKQLEKEEGILL